MGRAATRASRQKRSRRRRRRLLSGLSTTASCSSTRADQGQKSLAEQHLDQPLQPAGIQQPQRQGDIEHGGGKHHQQGEGHIPEAQGQIRPITLAGFQLRQQVEHGSAPHREHGPPLAESAAAACGSSQRRHQRPSRAGGRGQDLELPNQTQRWPRCHWRRRLGWCRKRCHSWLRSVLRRDWSHWSHRSWMASLAAVIKQA
jgi:hypothetical protein